MKKKKFPVMWVVGIVAMFTVVLAMNATGGGFNFAALFNKPEQAEAAENRPQPSADQAKAAMKDQIVGVSKSNEMAAPEMVPDRPGMPGAGNDSSIPTEPAIFIPEKVRYEEKPNESATSNQWYRDESYVGKQGEEVKENRTIE